ncbi:MAG TPA: helix-turn-helix domain-containing protein [Pyrinomonadaceae bacterium]|nr:helix-turn-helix domain-containing protein [Pyrinomonadaceae bacterium]
MKLALPEKAKEVAEFRADPELQARIEELACKSTEGELSDAEREEYLGYARANAFIAILQRQARAMIKSPSTQVSPARARRDPRSVHPPQTGISSSVRPRMEAIIEDMLDGHILLDEALEEFEKLYIQKAVTRHKRRMSVVAKALGIHRKTLSKRVNSYGAEKVAPRPPKTGDNRRKTS